MVDNVCYLLIVFDLLQLFCVLFFPLSSLELIIIMNSILSPLLADLRQLLFRSSFQVYRIHLETIAEYFHVIFYHFSNSIRAFSSVQFSRSVVPVHHQLPEFTQTHVHRVSDAIQPSHPLSSPFPPAPNPSQHQSFPMNQLAA